ncbi:MAG TPA: kelch repeat-containing protein [Acidimicrobiia bacterium]|nr:kelch repeat-containing protein [Acidimicrobiia bacterium]
MRHLSCSLALVAIVACGGDSSTTSADGPSTTGATPEVTTTVTSTTASATSGWERLAAMPTPRSEVPAAVLDGEIYVPGGYTAGNGMPAHGTAAFEAFDPVANSWRRLADLPGARHHLMAAAFDGRVFVFGGYDADSNEPTATAWSYDPASDEWTDVTEMPAAVAAGAAVTAGDHIYVIGGIPGGTNVYRYEPRSDTWDEVAPLLQPTEHVALAVHEGQLFALGGRWAGEELATVQVYALDSDSWVMAPPLQLARGGFGAASFEGRVVAIGGEVAADRNSLVSVEVLDPGTGAWTFGERLPVPLHGHAVVIADGQLFVVGGSRVGAGVVNFGDTLVGRP